MTYRNNLPVNDLTRTLSLGCPTDKLNDSYIFHCGMIGRKAFSHAPGEILSRLHDIYYSQPGDSIPTWSKWEALRVFWMNDLKVCLNVSHPFCKGGWETRTCVPELGQEDIPAKK